MPFIAIGDRMGGMPIYNVKKKMAKAAERLGFAEGEEVIAAAMTFPDGHKNKSVVKMAAGGVGLMSHDAPADGGAAAKMPGGQNFLAVTNYRLLVTTVKSVSTNPKELVAEWGVDEVHSISVEPGLMASTIEVKFLDGSSFRLDGARSSGAEELDGIIGV